MPKEPQRPQAEQADQVQLQYADHPEIYETFVDGLEKYTVDGSVVRLEFVVVRMDPSHPNQPSTGKKHTASRIVIPAMAFLAIVSEFNKMIAGLQQAGAIKVMGPGSPTGKAN